MQYMAPSGHECLHDVVPRYSNRQQLQRAACSTYHQIDNKQFHPRNTQLPSPMPPSTHLSPISPPFTPTHAPHSDYCIHSSQANLVPIKASHTRYSVDRAHPGVFCRWRCDSRKKHLSLSRKRRGETRENPIYQPRSSKVTSRWRNGQSCPSTLS
jgi:hypothetical protein